MQATIRQDIIDQDLLVPVQNGEDWIDGNIHPGPYEARYHGDEFQIKINGVWTEAVSIDFELK